MGMCAEPFARDDSVLVEHAESAKVHELAVLVAAPLFSVSHSPVNWNALSKAPCVERLEPSVVRMAACVAVARNDLDVR